ncbi:MAG: MotA/TolQ/ExbB proton channel family protein [Defluviitaleaceae bacterium]|nr:MotA/TolQ/ExbB proton channel family protein [Defluviitaleaceae bacterium]MCL2837216.1 MotA/TolQ/ExbB proton channel family protein [Defluviitaleaceae bacterium]
MINYVNEMMAAQTLPGQVICYIIFAVFAVYMVMSVCVLTFYSSVSKKARRLRTGRDMNAGGAFFNHVQNSFEAVARKGVRDVGATEILDDAVPPVIKLFEYIIHYLPSLATIVGLLGTFVGLTAAIGRMNLSIDTTISIEAVINNINAPMSDMSTAFYTSLVGIIASAAMNIFERITRLYVRGPQALAEVRDFINIEFQSAILSAMPASEKFAVYENDPASIAWGDASRRIAKALSSLKESVDKMSDDISSLETRGILSLSNNITNLIRTYQLEHDDVTAVNESMRSYLAMLQELGRSLEQNNRITSRSEELLEQMASTYRMLAEEHRLYENALTTQMDTELMRTVRDQLKSLISRLEGAFSPR